MAYTNFNILLRREIREGNCRFYAEEHLKRFIDDMLEKHRECIKHIIVKDV